MEEFGAPDGTSGALQHCGEQLVFKKSQHGWEGDFEKSHLFFECGVCGLLVVVEFVENVGPPSGVA